MFIAHLPAGYLIGSSLARRYEVPRAWIAVAMIGAVFPDFDLIYFYAFDGRQHLHHSYWIHKPLYWAGISAVMVGLSLLLRSKWLQRFCLFFLPNVFGHLVLDTWVGHIRWLSPLTERSFVVFDLPSTHGWWVWNFVLHPTFLLEVAILIAAVAVWISSRSGPRRSRGRERCRAPSSVLAPPP